MRHAFRITLLTLLLGIEGNALAQDVSSEPTPAQVRTAAEAFDKGREAYKSEDYVEAAEQFERADGNAPSAAALELAVRSRDKAGELDRAATLVSLGLRHYPDDQNLRKLAGDLLKRASATLFQLTANCDQPCDLTVGGKLVHGAPESQRLIYLQPGNFTLRAGWSDNRSASRQVQAEAGGKGEVSFTAPENTAAQNMAKEPSEPAPAPVAPSPAERDTGANKKSSGWSPTVFYLGAGATVVLGGITVWSGIDTVNNPGRDKVKAACSAGAADCQSLYDQGHSKQTRTNVLIGVTSAVGVATILVGVLATDWGGHKRDSASAAQMVKPRVDVAPWASLDGGGLQAVGRF